MIDIQDVHLFALKQMYRLHQASFRIQSHEDAMGAIEQAAPMEDLDKMVKFLLQDQHDTHLLKLTLEGEVGNVVAMHDSLLILNRDGALKDKQQLMYLKYDINVERVLLRAQEKVDWVEEAQRNVTHTSSNKLKR